MYIETNKEINLMTTLTNGDGVILYLTEEVARKIKQQLNNMEWL